LKKSARLSVSFLAIALLLGPQTGCMTSTEVPVADPSKEKVPAPPEPIKPGDVGSKPPPGGGSPPGDPSKYTR